MEIKGARFKFERRLIHFEIGENCISKRGEDAFRDEMRGELNGGKGAERGLNDLGTS